AEAWRADDLRAGGQRWRRECAVGALRQRVRVAAGRQHRLYERVAVGPQREITGARGAVPQPLSADLPSRQVAGAEVAEWDELARVGRRPIAVLFLIAVGPFSPGGAEA